MTTHPTGTATKSRPRGKRKVLTLILVVIMSIVGTAWVVDSLVAARTENIISEKLKNYSNLPVQPAVNAGGFPFLYEVYRGKLSSLTVSSSDLTVPGFGLASIHSSATNIEASPSDLLNGRIENAPVETVSTTISLDGLALGERLGITDLTIRRLANQAPNGGQESDAVFSGSIKGLPTKATAAIRLRIKADDISMQAYEVLDGPDSLTSGAKIVSGKDVPQNIKDTILKAFTLHLQGKYLPLRARPDFIYCEGGSIFLQASRQNVNINLLELAPMAKKEDDLSTQDPQERHQ